VDLFAFGLVVVVSTSASALFTIVLPREPRGFADVAQAWLNSVNG
jgi:hypothetical protein